MTINRGDIVAAGVSGLPAVVTGPDPLVEGSWRAYYINNRYHVARVERPYFYFRPADKPGPRLFEGELTEEERVTAVKILIGCAQL